MARWGPAACIVSCAASAPGPLTQPLRVLYIRQFGDRDVLGGDGVIPGATGMVHREAFESLVE